MVRFERRRNDPIQSKNDPELLILFFCFTDNSNYKDLNRAKDFFSKIPVEFKWKRIKIFYIIDALYAHDNI